MSTSPQYSQGGNNHEPIEDCRDYLRTGRCKYGASCKYNHPPNVQNGGGMKMPLNPSEPLFPIRPNELPCQYYMKHGTCKFGQACKFNHPPQAVGQGGGQILLNGIRSPEIASQQMVLNPIITDPNGQGMMLQLLPQRPDEPDCIYFLKNGRCKYGATCRYHHPVNFNQQSRRGERPTPRRPQAPQQDPSKGQKVHYITQLVHNYPHGQMILTDNPTPVTFINVDGFAQQGYQIISGVEPITSYCVPVQAGTGTAVMTEQSSSASSIASYETSNEHLGESASAHWNRAKRNGSGGSLSAYIADNRVQTRGSYIPHSASEGNMSQSRRLRTASYGSMSDTVYYDAVAAHGIPRNTSSSSWRSDRSPTYEPVQRITPQSHIVTADGKVIDPRSIQSRSRPPALPNPQRRAELIRMRGARPGEPDEGFTMMTSALLHMLDTPEETSGENYSEDEYIQTHVNYQISDRGGMTEQELYMYERLQAEQRPSGMSTRSTERPTVESARYSSFSPQEVDATMLERLSLQPTSSGEHRRNEVVDSSWSPTWQGVMRGNQIEAVSPPSMMHSMLHQPHDHRSTAQNSALDSDIGLYLP